MSNIKRNIKNHKKSNKKINKKTTHCNNKKTKNATRKYKKIKGGDDNVCSICLDDFDKNDCRNLSRFKCYHIYHKSCIESYQKVSNNVCCPLCRV